MTTTETAAPAGAVFGRRDPDARGYFGAYGGRFVPETLVAPVAELEAAYLAARGDPGFRQELATLLDRYVGRPTSMSEARRWSEEIGGARVFLKREDLAHTGAHKINNALGQALLAVRMGKRRVVAETGAGHDPLPGAPERIDPGPRCGGGAQAVGWELRHGQALLVTSGWRDGQWLEFPVDAHFENLPHSRSGGRRGAPVAETLDACLDSVEMVVSRLRQEL